MMRLPRGGAPLNPGTLSLVLYPTNVTSTVGQYSGRVPGQESSRKAEQQKAVQILLENPKGAAVVDG